MSIIVNDLSYHYFSQDLLFENVSFSVEPNRKISIIANNGIGKTTLLRLLAGEIEPSSGSIACQTKSYYIPQQAGLKGISVSEALSVSRKLKALHAITNGSILQEDYDIFAEDWDIETRCTAALEYWNLSHINFDTSIDLLSGGEKTKVFLAGLMIHSPNIILLDEPTNHLDYNTRDLLYEYIDNVKATVVIVSHDINLLNRLDTTLELFPKGIKLYGGNFDFYKNQKAINDNALNERILSETKSLREAKKKAVEVKHRQEKRARQGEKNKMQIIPILRKTKLNKGEETGAKLNEKHAKIIQGNKDKLGELRQQQNTSVEFKIDFDNTQLHKGKLLVSADGVNFEYNEKDYLWKLPLSLEVHSGERIHITGNNGTGKTTLIKLLIGELSPTRGNIKRAEFSYIYLDQEYTQVKADLTVLEMAQKYNLNNLPDHEVKLRLNRALFPHYMWDKNCETLSGGEKMRLYLCCLMLSNHVPDLFILDEPTNNLDLSSLTILTDTIKNYQGTLLVISHDKIFIDEIKVTSVLELE